MCVEVNVPKFEASSLVASVKLTTYSLALLATPGSAVARPAPVMIVVKGCCVQGFFAGLSFAPTTLACAVAAAVAPAVAAAGACAVAAAVVGCVTCSTADC